VLSLKAGAFWSLLASPEKTKFTVSVSVLAPVPALPVLNNIQGTATCFPPVRLGVVVTPGVVVVAPGVVADVAPAELTDRIAKSMRPELGLIMASLSVPTCCPDELVT
jgi:hypothetical protein